MVLKCGKGFSQKLQSSGEGPYIVFKKAQRRRGLELKIRFAVLEIAINRILQIAYCILFFIPRKYLY